MSRRQAARRNAMTVAAEDTIAAIATPVGTGGVGIIKISGAQSWSIGRRLFRPAASTFSPESHRLYYGQIVDPASGAFVDEALVSFMRAPRTYTREDVVEINCHSGLAVLRQILQLVLDQGARLAEAGEFTRRAFIHGRIDLTRAEAVAELIRARTQKSLALASEHLRGGLYREVSAIRDQLLALLAEVEAAIDFPEEEIDASASHLLARLRQEVIEPTEHLLSRYEDGRVIREGISVLIAGKPNVGKSSLLNRLLRSDRALVTPIPGTTRDIIEEELSIGGVPVRLADSAGLRHSDDVVEQLGVQLTRDRLARADLVLFVVDRSVAYTDEDRDIEKEIRGKPRLVVINKKDLPPHPEAAAGYRELAEDKVLEVSALTGEGIELLQEEILAAILRHRLDTETSMVAPNLRHRRCLQQAKEAAARAHFLLASGGEAELLALELREALNQFGEVIGLTTSEDVLDEIFSRFCIGK